MHIVTAHTADTKEGLPEDFDALAKLSGTLIFLMGLTRLSAITDRLIAAGKDPNTPAAVISGGNAPFSRPLPEKGLHSVGAGKHEPAGIILSIFPNMPVICKRLVSL